MFTKSEIVVSSMIIVLAFSGSMLYRRGLSLQEISSVWELPSGSVLTSQTSGVVVVS